MLRLDLLTSVHDAVVVQVRHTGRDVYGQLHDVRKARPRCQVVSHVCQFTAVDSHLQHQARMSRRQATVDFTILKGWQIKPHIWEGCWPHGLGAQSAFPMASSMQCTARQCFQ
jgi:hypothetical protein